MPLVYACICPHPPLAHEGEARRTFEALRRVADEIASYQPETALLVGPPTSRGQAIGVVTAPCIAGDFAQWGAPGRFEYATDQELAARIQEEATQDDVRLKPVPRWDGAGDWGYAGPLYHLRAALETSRLLVITASPLAPRFHFDAGRAIGRALASHDRRVALICSAQLSHARGAGAASRYDPAGRVFDERYRRAIEAWDVKWLVGLEAQFRRHAAEGAVAQTALLMGALSGSRIQPRVLSYEAPLGAGELVAAIDVVGKRGR